MVASSATLPDASERQRRQRAVHGRGVHAGATGSGAAQYIIRDGGVLREHVQRQRPLARVHIFDRLVQRVVGLDRQHRAEDLLLHQREVLGRVDHQRYRQLARGGIGLAAILERPHVASPRPRLLEQPFDALEVPAEMIPCSCPSAVAGHRLANVVGREPRELLELGARDEAVVHRDAHLPVLDRLRREHLLDRLGIDAVRGEDRRALAAQLERDRHELLGRGLRDLAPDRGAARVEEVIPAHARECTRELEAADDDIDAVAVERRVNHLPQQRRARGRVLRGLDHHAVAGGEHLDERTHRQVEREVPRHDVADDALRLGLHVRAP